MGFPVWTGGALLGLAGLVYLAGWLLPVAREGRAEVVIAAPPAQVVAVIADVEAQLAWRAGIATVERTAEGWVEVTARGERIAFVAAEMGEARVRLRFASDAGYSGTWEAVLLPKGAGTRVSVVERAEAPSPLRRILARLFFDPEAFATTYLAALKARVEGM
jgi:carbon monoxide dehydrogenase subunit G